MWGDVLGKGSDLFSNFGFNMAPGSMDAMEAIRAPGSMEAVRNGIISYLVQSHAHTVSI